MIDLEARLRVTFARVAELDDIAPLPDLSTDSVDPGALDELLEAGVTTPARRPRRRRVLSGLAALAVLGGGLSIAAAAGLPVLPAPVLRALGWDPVPGAYSANPATARLLLTVPGPAGIPLHLWYADADDDGFCLSFTAVVSTDRQAPDGFVVAPAKLPGNGVAAGGCAGPMSDPSWRVFGGAAFTASNSQSATYIVHVPGAATVWLQLDDGTSTQLSVADAWTAGWLTRSEAAKRPVLVGLATDGTEVGRFDMVDAGAEPSAAHSAHRTR